MLKGERAASLSEAESQNSCLKIRERSAKDPRNIRERSRKPSKPPALQAVRDDIIAEIRFWLYGLTGWVLELRVSSNVLLRKLVMVFAKGALDFREEVILS